MRMMAIQKAVRTKPFKPLLIRLDDGNSVLLRHPENISFGKREFVVWEADADDWHFLSTAHVVEIEPAGNRSRSK